MSVDKACAVSGGTAYCWGAPIDPNVDPALVATCAARANSTLPGAGFPGGDDGLQQLPKLRFAGARAPPPATTSIKLGAQRTAVRSAMERKTFVGRRSRWSAFSGPPHK